MRRLTPLLLLFSCSEPEPNGKTPTGTTTGSPCVGTTCGGTPGGTTGGTPGGTTGGTTTGTPGGTTTPTVVYELDLPSANVLSPPGLGAISSLFVDSPSLVEVLASGATLDLRAAATDGFAQERCQPTADSLGTDFSSAPFFDALFEPFPVRTAGVALPMDDAYLSGELDPVANTLVNVELEGSMNMSSLAPLVGSDPCGLLQTFGVNCVACPSGVVECLDVHLDQIPVTNVAGPLFLRTDADVANDPACP